MNATGRAASAPNEDPGLREGFGLLETSGLTVRFGAVIANQDIDLRVEPGSFVGLIGPNGAGKTTFVDALTGFVPTSSGSVVFDGKPIDDLPAHKRAQSGLVRTFQQLELFEDLTVWHNLLVAGEKPGWRALLSDLIQPGRRSAGVPDAEWALSAVGLDGLRDALPNELSHGQRKLVGVARALAARPKLLLLDEPAAGLDTAETRALGGQLSTLTDHGISVLMIEHDMNLVLSLCDHIHVLDFGQKIASGTPDEIRSNPVVVSAYLGQSASSTEATP